MPVPQNSIAFQKMVRQNQALLRQEIMPTRQQTMQGAKSAPNQSRIHSCARRRIAAKPDVGLLRLRPLGGSTQAP